MTATEYCHVLRLLNAALAVCNQRGEPVAIRRQRLRKLSVEMALLRARLGQPPANLQRN